MLAASGGAAAAAAAERLRQIEEEEMTGYRARELSEDWEFKILRSSFGAFRSSEKLLAILEEEKRGGWIFVEKFDNQRIRLKRPASAKTVVGEFADNYDPYRTEISNVSGPMVLAILAVSAATFILFVLLVLRSQ